MDALILGVVLNNPSIVWQGAMHLKKMGCQNLNAYNMLPIYRQSEGVANLQHNANSFELCQQLLKQNKTILIFVEGLCENNWQLRPLKKV
jgi:1-acyl-sn-glycerol-3-phosphate acyltransferase